MSIETYKKTGKSVIVHLKGASHEIFNFIFFLFDCPFKTVVVLVKKAYFVWYKNVTTICKCNIIDEKILYVIFSTVLHTPWAHPTP